MKDKIKKNIMFSIIICLILIFSFSNITFAKGAITGGASEILTEKLDETLEEKKKEEQKKEQKKDTVSDSTFNPDDWVPAEISGDDKIIEKGNIIVGAVKSVGSIVSVIALIILGIKYLIGSVEEKAQYKKTMIPYVVGAIMVFAISNILSALYAYVSTW